MPKFKIGEFVKEKGVLDPMRMYIKGIDTSYQGHVGFYEVQDIVATFSNYRVASNTYSVACDYVEKRYDVDTSIAMDFNGIPYALTRLPIGNQTLLGDIECVHDWAEYNSGWRTVTYCKKCNKDKVQNV